MGLPPQEIEIIRIGPSSMISARSHSGRSASKGRQAYEGEYDLIKLHPQIGKRILEKAGAVP